MIENETNVSLDNLDTEKLAQLHDIYATTHQILTQRVQFYHEEFEFISLAIKFYKEQVKTLREELEKRTPKKEEGTSGQDNT